MGWVRLSRRPATEFMDRALPDPTRLRESLEDLALFNRYLGGTATVLHQLLALLRGAWPARLRALDVGAGGGDILASLGRWCARHGVVFEGVALDAGLVTSRLAAAWLRESAPAQGIKVVCGAASALPFADEEFHVGICSTFLHHLEPEGVVDTLGEMVRVSQLGVVAADLRRGWPAYLAARSLAATLWRRHPYSRHDAPASVHAAYSLGEARELAERAGLAGAVVQSQPFFRWALRWERRR